MKPTLALPSGPKGLPLIGSALDFAKDPLGFFVKTQERFGEVAYQSIFGQHYFLLYSSELVEHVLVKNARNYRKNKFLKGWSLFFGDGLLTSDGEVWKKDRKLIQPLFQREKVIAYTELMRVCSESHFSQWRPGQTHVVSGEMNKLTMAIFVRSLLGIELDEARAANLSGAFDDCMAYFHFTANPVGFAVGAWPLPVNRRYQRAVADLDRLLGEIIAARRPQAEAADQTAPDDLISTLIRARTENGERLNDRQIRDQLLTFFFAGHETTALTLGFSLHLLSTHPEQQRKLRQELESRLGDRELTQEKLGELPYLRSVVQEAMRMYPSSWMLGREAIEPDRLGAYDVPAGATLVVPIWAYHRDPRYYPEPMAFRPERWTPEFHRDLPRTKYMPFGYGSRNCIGSMFAMFELQFALASLYRRFGTELVGSTEIKISPSVTARPSRPIVVKLLD